MKISKTLFWITLFGGIIVLGIGLYLQLSQTVSHELVFSRYGPPGEVRMTGFVGIFVGIGLLLLAIFNYIAYKDEKKKFERME